MSEILRLRDHSQPCEHDNNWYWMGTREAKVYMCSLEECPGGAAIIAEKDEHE